MQSQADIDRTLERWGAQLLRPGLRRYGMPGSNPSSARRAPLSGAAIRAGLRAIVSRTPEVMVKVTGGGRGMGSIRAHMTYISRKGELALENQDGLQLKGKEDLAELADEWRYGGGLIPEVSHRREAFHVMFSMPPGPIPRRSTTQPEHLPGTSLPSTNMPWSSMTRPPTLIRADPTFTWSSGHRAGI